MAFIKSNEDAKTPENSSIGNPSMLTINTHTRSMPTDHRGKTSVIFTLVVGFFFFFLKKKKISAIVKFMEKQNYLRSEGCESAFYRSMSN